MYMTWIWLGIAVAAFILEFLTPQIVSVWFSISALLCLGLSFIPTLPWWGQIIIFFGVATILLLLLRPVCQKYFLKGMANRTNVEALIGKEVRMITTADFDHLGSAKVNDVVWSVKAKGDEVLSEGEIVEILDIEGNKLVAKRKE